MASELQMVMQALAGFKNDIKTEISSELSKFQKQIDSLTAQAQIIPSSQPHADYGDWTLPTTAEANKFDNHLLNAPADLANFTAPDDVDLNFNDPNPDQTRLSQDAEIDWEGRCFDLAARLGGAFNDLTHEVFGLFLAPFFRSCDWKMDHCLDDNDLQVLRAGWKTHRDLHKPETIQFNDKLVFRDLYHVDPSHDYLTAFSAKLDRFFTANDLTRDHVLESCEHRYLLRFLA